MKLYKYRGFKKGSNEKTWTKKIMSEQELFFSSIKAFNDPFDGKVKLKFDGKLNEIIAAQARVQYTNKLVKKEKHEGITMNDSFSLVSSRITSEVIESSEFKDNLEKRVQSIHDSKGVLALSAIPDNILMWSHYADNHYGICFGFDWNEEVEVFGNYKKVKYQTHYDEVWSWLHTDDEIVEGIIFNKSIDWNYEKEFRIVIDNIGAVKFDKLNLTEIIFGCKTDSKDIDEVIELAKKHELNVKFKQAKIDVNTYTLNIENYNIE